MAVEIDFIGMPMNLGCRRPGVEAGAEVLRELVFGKERRHRWNDLGNVPCCSIEHCEAGDDKLFPHIAEIRKSCILLRDVVAQSLRNGHFPFVAGGDHVISWGSLAGVLKAIERPGCLYIDAHGDFNSAAESPSHNVHGMHMCYLMGFERHRVADAIQGGRFLDSADVNFVGTRSLDAYEKRMVASRNVAVHERYPAGLRGCGNLHVSFDIDVLDPSVAPGTGVPEQNGMNLAEVMAVLAEAFKCNNVCSFDFVEVNPLLDVAHRTVDVAGTIVDYLDRELIP